MLSFTQFKWYFIAACKKQEFRKARNAELYEKYLKKLEAYDDMLLAMDVTHESRENLRHTDIIEDMADIIYQDRDKYERHIILLYDWSVCYTTECEQNDIGPSSIAVRRFINNLNHHIFCESPE